MIFPMGKKCWFGVGLVLVAVFAMIAGGYVLRLFLHELADRSLPRPPDDVLPAEVVRLPASSVRDVRTDYIGGAGIGSLGRSLEVPPALPVINEGSLDVLPGDYILWVQDRFTRERLLALAQRHGVSILDQYGQTVRVRVTDSHRLAALLAALGGQVDVEANVRVRVPLLDEIEDAMPAPSTPYTGFGDQALAWLGIAEPDPRWGSGVRVAVLDTGISGVPVGQRVDLVGQGEQGEHGALVAGILHQALPGATLLDVQVMSAEGTGDGYTVAKGIREAVDAGANLINMSIGTRGESRMLAEAVQYALDNDVLIVASAGNEGVERISYPAAYDGVLSVAAVDAEERHLHFSNRGDRIDLAAPGVGVTVRLDDEEAVSFSGTSAAAPFVTATAGIALSSDSTLRGESLQRIVLEHANDTGAPGPDPLTGNGIVSPQRVQERDEPGIVDMAVLRPQFDTDADGHVHSVTVAAQNRGTVDQADVEMVVVVDGERYRLDFSEVGRGRTVAHTLEVPQERGRDDVLDVQVEVRLPEDIRPENNQIRSLWMPESP